jgi:hypothetical protein
MRATAGLHRRGSALATLLGAVVLVVCQSGYAADAARADGASFTVVEYHAQSNMKDRWTAAIMSQAGKTVTNSELTLKPGDKVRGRRLVPQV